MTFGDKLSRLRKQHNYTQEQLADILDVSRQSVSKWESDAAFPETDKLIKLSALFGCTVDYLLKEDVTDLRPDSPKKPIGMTLLNFAPATVFLLWAVTLWATFCIRIFKGMSATNLYMQLTCPVMADIRPVLCLLVCFAALAAIMGVALIVCRRYVGKRLCFFLETGGFVLYIAVFVCTSVLLGQIWYFGQLRGAFTTVLEVLTPVFAAVQALLMLFRSLFQGGLGSAAQRLSSVTKRLCKAFWAKRVWTLSVTAALVVSIVLSVALPVTLCDIFRIEAVSGISLGDSREQVRKRLGEPIDLQEIMDIAEIGAELPELPDEDDWCSDNARRCIDEVVRLARLVSDGIDEDFASLAAGKMMALLQHLTTVKAKTISVGYDGGVVTRVQFDNNAAFTDSQAKWNKAGNRKQKIELIDNVIPAGELPFTAELRYKAYYTDGSYAVGYMQNVSAVQSSDGWLVNWSDDWGNYEQVIPASQGGASDGSVVGSIGSAFFKLTPVVGGYKLLLAGGAQGGRDSIAEYSSRITEVELQEGLTEIPDGIFEGMTLDSITLPSTVTRIGDNAFRNCRYLSSVNLDNVEQIGDYAFAGCTLLDNVRLGQNFLHAGSHAFEGCTSLKNLNFGGWYYGTDGFTLGEYAFAGCTSLRDVWLDNVGFAVRIPAHCFDGCRALCNVYYDDVAEVGEYAFANCTSLLSYYTCFYNYLDEDASIRIGSYAFYNCTSLTGVTFGPAVKFVGRNAFAGSGVTTVIFEVENNSTCTWRVTDDTHTYTIVLTGPRDFFPDEFLKYYSSYDWIQLG